MSCRQQRKTIDRLFLGEVSAATWRDLNAHLKTCEGCARYYDRAAFAMRALSGRPGEVSPEELYPVGEAFAATSSSASSRWLTRGIAALAIATSVATLVVVSVRRATTSEGVVTARGAPAVVDVQVRSYCLREDTPGKMRVVAASSEENGRLTCGVGDYVQFTYLLRGSKPMYLSIAGQTESSEVLHYYPRADEPALRIEPSGREEPLPGSVRLSAKHKPGQVKVAAVVSESPLTAEALFRVFESGRAANPAARVLRLSLEITP